MAAVPDLKNRQLHLGTDAKGRPFNVPINLVTQTQAILARKGAGKTYTGCVEIEELVAAGMPVLCIDRMGVMWGLRTGATCKEKGLPIVLFGGEHADLPLGEFDGKRIAEVIVEKRVSAVLDLSELETTAGQRRFFTDFATRLFEVKNKASSRYPMHIMVDEADVFCPQHVTGPDTLMVRAFENIVRRGRTRGLGVTMITQRPASLNKDVLTQTEMLVCMQITGPQDRKAVEAWVRAHDTGDVAEEFLESLASLPVGTGWVWSPQWLNCFDKVKFRRRRTLDTSATPDFNAAAPKIGRLAPVDIEALTRELGQIVEREKAADPTVLRRRINELEGQIRKLGSLKDEVKKHVPPPSSWPTTTAMNKWVERIRNRRLAFEHDVDVLKQLESEMTASPVGIVASARTETSGTGTRVNGGMNAASHGVCVPSSNGQGMKGERIILLAVAQYRNGVTRQQLSVLTGYKRSSRDTYLQRLRSRGQIETQHDRYVVTAAGVAALGQNFEALPTGSDLRVYWLERLSGGERMILDQICSAHPQSVDVDRLSEISGYKRSARDTFLSRLLRRELITRTADGFKASETLCDGDG